MVQQLQWKNPIGKNITIKERTGTVIGVSQDFLFRSVTNNIAPTILLLAPEKTNYMIIKYSYSNQFSDIIGTIKKQWDNYAPNTPFEFITMNDYHKNIYRGGRVFLALFSFTDIIAMLIACLGLIGLASYAVERRKKEIGIRKTLGASVIGIIRLLIKDFIILIVLSNIIGLPIAYFLTNQFLNMGFIYNRITIGPAILILTIMITMFTALIAVSSQTLKTARTNPVNSLRYE
jgi:putative ABC transport system permease protein